MVTGSSPAMVIAINYSLAWATSCILVSYEKHRNLVSLFMANAKKMIEEKGEIHIDHKCNKFFGASGVCKNWQRRMDLCLGNVLWALTLSTDPDGSTDVVSKYAHIYSNMYPTALDKSDCPNSVPKVESHTTYYPCYRIIPISSSYVQQKNAISIETHVQSTCQMTTMPCQKIEAGHQDVVHDVVMDYYGKRLATASSDATIKIIGVSNSGSRHLATLSGHQGRFGVSRGRTRSRFDSASCSYDGKVIIWKEGNRE
ncbi:hypothetical protein Scep_013587 [Stephania cephalantha]|uniref:Uncharacterized protein n=1 Tax=Stephania cephalantha TaxID=152367 RepID=A0AAP0JHR8_9MAGN